MDEMDYEVTYRVCCCIAFFTHFVPVKSVNDIYHSMCGALSDMENDKMCSRMSSEVSTLVFVISFFLMHPNVCDKVQ